MSFYKNFVRPVLFQCDPETVHEKVISALAFCGSFRLGEGFVKNICEVREVKLQVNVMGLEFPNPVGLAAGFDKNSEAFLALSWLGFGFLEIGTVTAIPQEGNPRPRLFRVPRDLALVNKMGFNNDGAEIVACRLKALYPFTPPLGINIGKSRIVPIEDAVLDYAQSFKALYNYGHYFVVNVSSPNTPGLRTLQESIYLKPLLNRLLKERESLVTPNQPRKPLLVKISPDCSNEELDGILDVIKEAGGIDGIIAANTSNSRDGLAAPSQIPAEGGLSGAPLRERSTNIIKYIYRMTNGELPIIGVGGIFSAKDAIDKIKAGASLVQIYTGMVYEGPFIVKNILSGILRFMDKEGVKNLSDIIGLDVSAKA